MDALDVKPLLLIGLLCIGMAFYEVKDNAHAVVALASMLIKFAVIPLLLVHHVELIYVGAIALLPLSRTIEYVNRKINDRLDKDNNHDSNSDKR